MSEKSKQKTEKTTPGPAGSGEPGNRPGNPGGRRTTGSNTEKSRTASHRTWATALRGQGIGRPPAPKSVVRRQTQGDIFGKDPEIPYVKFEAAARDLVCSLMERQDRMNEEIFYRINDLGYRAKSQRRPGGETGAGNDPGTAPVKGAY